jgi:geranylgeranyl pyrophosphate synthase
VNETTPLRRADAPLQATIQIPSTPSPRRARADAQLFDDERSLHQATRQFVASLGAHPVLGAAAHAPLRQMLASMLNASGKRVRPLLPYWMWRAQGADPAALPGVARVALATLLVHSAAVTIDDVEDGSVERGGHCPMHVREGGARTMNAATALVFAALEDLGDPALVGIAVDAILRCHAGQALDLDASDPRRAAPLFDATQAERVERHRACASLKTAALLALPLRAAAHRLGLPAELSARAAAAAGSYGVGYQILDDVKNFRADLLGAKAFEDLRHGLKNWVCLDLFGGWSAARCDEARRLYGTSALDALFLDDAALPGALRRGVEAGAGLMRGAVLELSRLCPDRDGSHDYLSALLERPLDDLVASFDRG